MTMPSARVQLGTLRWVCTWPLCTQGNTRRNKHAHTHESLLFFFNDNKVKIARKPGKKQGKSGIILLLFHGNKMKMARKPGKKQKENSIGCTGEVKKLKGKIREGSREGITVTISELSLEVR